MSYKPSNNKLEEQIEREEAILRIINSPDLGMAAPESGFLRDYYDYASELTDAPEHYHLFVGHSILSAVLGRNVFIPFGAQKIFPNLWVILLAPSSVFRKSTCIHMGRDILHKLDDSLIQANEFTPESLLAGLVDKPHGIFLWSEFGGALSCFERSYMVGMKETLTDLYDCPPIYKRKLREKEFIIENPCLSILAGTAIDWFLSKCKEGDIRSGFLARFVYVPAFKKSKRIAIPLRADPSVAAKIVRELQKLADIKGEVNTDLVKPTYEDWLFSHEDQLDTEANAESLSGFWSRLGMYVLKFALLYNISEEKSLVISTVSLLKAIELVELLKQSVKVLVKEEWVFGQDAKEKQKLLRIIRNKPGIDRRRLLQNSNMIAQRFKAVLDTLIQEGSVVPKDGSYYPNSGDEATDSAEKYTEGVSRLSGR
jgi:hypothetical protein